MPDDRTHWTVFISKQTDSAVRWRVFEQTLAEARTGFADLTTGACEALAEEAVTATRRAKATGAA